MAVAWNVTYSVVDFAGCVHSSRFISSFWLDLDDLLMAHTDPCFLTALGEYAAYLLERARFVLSKTSVSVPSTRIVWIGKVLDANTGFHNLPSRAASVFVAILALRTVSAAPQVLQRVLGYIQ